MNDVNDVYIEENGIYKIDFSSAIWSTDKLNKIFDDAKLELCDVDFIAETKNEILLVEYKNSDIQSAFNPLAFNPLDSKKISNVVKKYYDSLTYINAIGKYNKSKKYIYIVENPNGDSVLRNRIKIRLKKLLPFLLQEQNNFIYNLIDDVEVLSISEWNEKYKFFPLTKV